MLVKIQNQELRNVTCFLCGALSGSEDTWHMDQSTIETRLGHR